MIVLVIVIAAATLVGQGMAQPDYDDFAAMDRGSGNPEELLQPLAEWAIHVPNGRQAAERMCAEQDLEILDEVIEGSNYFHVRHRSPVIHSSPDPRWAPEDQDRHHRVQKRSVEKFHQEVTRQINDHAEVAWAEQQGHRSRVKRDAGQWGPPPTQQVPDEPAVQMNDPYWSKMWYLNRQDDFTMNVEGAWREGVTGKGVAVTILDDGIEKDHPDLIRNYDPLASTDINDNDSDPIPRYDPSDSNRHGTRCAGQVAASSNNSMCGVGIAFNAQIGGIRMLDGQVSDAVEARSLSFHPDHIDIYSSSWGPNDDGKTVDGPGTLAQRAFINGITRGRDGKGSIFVWASGNGGRYRDNCNCDGYATSIYTITVSSTSESGQIPWYSEACSSTLATTYSSGTNSEKQVVTTDLRAGCTVKHTGTSASAPMAAGIIALALEANPTLTWRDVQHIIVRTAKPANLRAPDWQSNGLGRKISHSYGYGLMDSAAMVRTAKEWTLVPRQEKCIISSPFYYKMIPAMGYITIDLEVEDCPGVNYLEHVVSPIHVRAGRKRGDLRIYLQSPMGTRSTLLDERPQDFTGSGFIDWPFMTTHMWGENPVGRWKLEIHNDAYSKWSSEAKFFRWSLELYGIEFDPNSSEYKKARLQDHGGPEEQQRFNVVREVPADGVGGRRGLEEASAAAAPSDHANRTSSEDDAGGLRDHEVGAFGLGESAAVAPSGGQGFKSGCVSKLLDCTQSVQDCRTFTRRMVANLFCKCSSICHEVAVTVDPYDSEQQAYNMQCSFSHEQDLDEGSDSRGQPKATHGAKVNKVVNPDPPMYCMLIPFSSF